MKSDIELSQKILEKIKVQNIRPLPKWVFKIRTLFLILIFILSTVFGSLSVSILWVNLKVITAYSHIRIGRGLGVFLVPSLWFFLSIIFLIIAYFHYRKSPRGYRASRLKLIGSLVGMSLVLGTSLFLSGYAQSVHRYIRHQMPVYGSLHKKMNAVSCKPSEGMLCGRFDPEPKLLFSSNFVILTAEDGQKWTVEIKESEVRGLPRIELERRVRIWGTQTGVENFKAIDIRPYPFED